MQDEPQIILRPLDEADIPRLLDIAVAAWDPIYASFRTLLGPDLFATAFPDWQTDKRRQIASACRGEHGAVVIVAERDGEPVGFISYYLNQTTKIGEIGNNAVDPQYQGAGIGPRMYDQALAQMREAGMRGARVTTGGDPSHAPARRAYEKAGFTRGLPSITYYQAL
jgi:ribosomal protein S18 acetylase RimI-like enzyme